MAEKGEVENTTRLPILPLNEAETTHLHELLADQVEGTKPNDKVFLAGGLVKWAKPFKSKSHKPKT
ncbi:Uncharacterised protein [Weissella viridescens]|uniref:Uncharacterized protein n=1 Tax=Weissella viridescens TaxID=1629 RepID=A0A380P1N6_WEIVI|nr:Uncharacterised protein [Weissella viridescens]